MSSQEIYRSPNGDLWHLLHEASTARWIVRHKANLSSGGMITDTDVLDFLHRRGPGPEYEALQTLLLEGEDAWLEGGERHPILD